jgi:osmotically inducible lipoprotein OsmB
MKKKFVLASMICAGLVGCSSVPGTAKQQGAVVGGATGAAVGASVTKNRALGAIIGGAVGAAGGYVIGGQTGHLDKKDSAEKSAQTNPATPTEASNARTADVNNDGFVTLDEIVAMDKAGVSDQEMLDRIRSTGLTFDLNEEQRKYLADHGVSMAVIDQLPQINRGTSSVVTPSSDGTAVISK